MARKNWRRCHPTNQQEALRLCLDYAEHRYNRGVQRVAEILGVTEWAIYGWLKEGSIPGKHVIGFEHACGCSFLSDYWSHAQGNLTIKIPTGRKATAEDINQLNLHLNETVGHILKFHESQSHEDANAAIWAISGAMEDLALQQHNLEKVDTPEFDFGERK
ncbi:MAG: hypothetical protein JMN25_17355 [gamma proteobacterium endosymbiont of Lamellibrachia anaximandri]|nr:hypothetical protein [gamma proteobacterium endosymbiont of Lamellibrachia anaximandri]